MCAKPSMDQNIDHILVSEAQIQKRIAELGKELSEYYQDKNPLLVGILKGALPFMSDLMKEMPILLEYDMMDVTSYGMQFQSSGEVKILKDLDTNVEGRHILFVEDIVDTGRTLSYLKNIFECRHAASIKICTLLNKPSGRDVVIEPDWCGFTIPDEFVVGYGLDFLENYRNLPYIGVMKAEFYENKI